MGLDQHPPGLVAAAGASGDLLDLLKAALRCAQIAALQASGADLVIGFNVPSYTALSQLQSLRLNYTPQWVYSNIGSEVGYEKADREVTARFAGYGLAFAVLAALGAISLGAKWR